MTHLENGILVLGIENELFGACASNVLNVVASDDVVRRVVETLKKIQDDAQSLLSGLVWMERLDNSNSRSLNTKRTSART